METQDYKDQVRQGRGFFPSAPLHTPEAVGDAAIAGKNCLFSKYGQIRSWRGFSPLNSPGAKLLHVVGGQLVSGQLVGGQLAGNTTGNVWKQHGDAVFLIGSGNTFLDDFFNAIGVASSQLQVRIGGQTYQAGLPKPAAPGLEIARDSSGQPIGGRISGAVSARLTRIRTVTGAESAASDTSTVVTLTNGRIRIKFPAALIASQGQDEWGVYLPRQGFGGEGPHLFFRQVKETDISPVALGAVAAGPGNGATTTFGGTTPMAVNSLMQIHVLAPAAGVLPSYVSSSFSITPGPSDSLRVQKPAGAQNGHFLMIQVTFKAVHRLTPAASNKGLVTITAVTGVWEAFPGLNPQAQGIKIIVEQDSSTTWRWKLATDLVFSAPIAMSTSPTVIGSTQLFIAWTANSSPEGVGNTFEIEPFSLIPPVGWENFLQSAGGIRGGTVGVGIWGRIIDASMGDFDDWTTSAPALISSLAVAWKDVNLSPISSSAAVSTLTPQTTHQVTLGGGAPTATQLVTFWFSGADNSQNFTPNSPLVAVVNTNQLARFIDADYADDDLNENILAPKDVEGPPAGTHGFPLGPITVVAGAFGGTALAPSRPNQPEQYDLTEVTYLNPPEPIVRCEISPRDGLIFIWTRNSLQTAIYTDEEISPVRAQTIWANTGIASPSGACLSKDGAYAATAKRGFARYVGSREPDTGYADAIDDYVKDWDPEDVAMGYDGVLEGVAHCRGKEILLYFETIGIWSPPLRIDLYDLEGDPDLQPRIVSCATLDSRLHFVIQTGEDVDEEYEIFVFDEGLGGEWFLRGVARHGASPGLTKTLSHLRLIADFTSDQLLGYRDFVGVHRRMGSETLVLDNQGVPGYCVGQAALPEYWTDRGLFRLEWTITAPQLAERWVAFTSSANLARYGSPTPPLPTTDYNTDSLLAWRVDSGGVLTWYLNGSGTAHASVQVNDVVRIEWEADGDAVGTLLRNGSPVGSPFAFGTPGGGWPKWLGFKVGLASGGTVSLGRLSFAPGGQSGRLKLWKNFAAERGGAPVFDKTYAADGDRTYDWEKPNLTQIVTYNVEVGGDSFDQDVSVVYIEGYTSDVHQPLLTQ